MFRFEFDRILFFVLVTLLGIGLLMIASAGVLYGESRFGDSYYFFKQQLLGLGVGFLALFFFQSVDYRAWKRFVVPVFFIAIALLILVFIPGFGTTVYGAARWVAIGPISFQPSEVMKLAIILYLSAWLSTKGQGKAGDFYEGLVPFLLILSFVGFLIIKQPDTGTLGLIFIIAMSIFFASGAKLAHIGGLAVSAFLFLLILIKLAPYRMQRLLVFLNPEHDPSGAGYQITQALIAVGSGGLFGIGLGQSRQKFNYLPEPVTDSIYAVLSEEFGLMGAGLVLCLFVFIAWRGFLIARGAQDEFGRLLAVGITTWIVGQAFINIGAISGLIPLTGIPLPFISYGGTSLAVLLGSFGILLNISKTAVIHTPATKKKNAA
jgi:cell division protein FtsW